MKRTEALVIDLLKKVTKQGRLQRWHMFQIPLSLKRAKLRAEVNEEQQRSEQNKKQSSIQSQAFKLFLEGKPVVKVAIELNLETDQALKIQSDYMVLRNMGLASRVLMEHRKDLGAYLGLLEFVNENKIKVKELNHAVGLAKNINNLKQEKAQLEYELDTLMDVKKWHEKELDEIKREYYKIR